MLIPLPAEDAQRLRGYFTDQGYTQDDVRRHLHAAELPSARLRNIARLLDRTREPSALNTLLRWFWIGISQTAEQAADRLPRWVVESLLVSGLVRREGSVLTPQVMMLPSEGFLIASDHASKIEAGDPELVLWPNPTSSLLSRFTVRRRSRATLDLGTGSGVLALTASMHSDYVVATDLNPRAAAFATFNARLNGIEGIEFRVGDAFAPVAGRTFDLIFSNPPFFISPSNGYMFCDNSMDLDQLCRRLVREAPAHLNEGGHFQMLCEWAELEGEPWQERVGEWFKDTGCDGWVLKGNTQSPSEYAQERIRSVTVATAHDGELYEGYMEYYRQRKVVAIHDGIVAMHRRPGTNWVLVDEVAQLPKDPFGDAVLQAFAARNFLASHASETQMLSIQPKLSEHARLERIFEPAEGRWRPASLTLRLARGFPSQLELQPLVAEFLSGCDGKRTLGELTQELAAKANVPLETVRKESLDMVRKLIERAFLLY
jgi:methylase of polypeptide subunit release factors